MAQSAFIKPEHFEVDATPKQLWLLFKLTGLTTKGQILMRGAAERLGDALGETPKWLSIGEASKLIDSIKSVDDKSEAQGEAVLAVRERLLEIVQEPEKVKDSPLPTWMAREEFREVWDSALEAGASASYDVTGDGKGVVYVRIGEGTARMVQYLGESGLATPDNGRVLYFVEEGDSFEQRKAFADAMADSINSAKVSYGTKGKTVKAEVTAQQRAA